MRERPSSVEKAHAWDAGSDAADDGLEHWANPYAAPEQPANGVLFMAWYAGWCDAKQEQNK